jgi:RNA polymerase sigma-70 factor (ECF subfamily)
MPREDESKLILRAKRGSADAFRQIVDAYKDRLFAFVWRIVRNHHEAEDLTQGAFVKAYEALNSYNDHWAFSTWLFTIAYRLCVNHVRKCRPVAGEVDFARFGTDEDDAPLLVGNTEEAARLKKLIWSAVEELSLPQKTAVLLFYREGKSCEEIGRVLGAPTVTVKSHLHRARARLREALEAELGETLNDRSAGGEARAAS